MKKLTIWLMSATMFSTLVAGTPEGHVDRVVGENITDGLCEGGVRRHQDMMHGIATNCQRVNFHCLGCKGCDIMK